MKLKKGDTILVIAGKDRGKTGVIEAVLPQANRIVVTGVNKYKKHVKPTAAHPQGGIIELFRSLDASNVMFLDSDTKKPTRLGLTSDKKSKQRTAKVNGKAV